MSASLCRARRSLPLVRSFTHLRTHAMPCCVLLPPAELLDVAALQAAYDELGSHLETLGAAPTQVRPGHCPLGAPWRSPACVPSLVHCVHFSRLGLVRTERALRACWPRRSAWRSAAMFWRAPLSFRQSRTARRSSQVSVPGSSMGGPGRRFVPLCGVVWCSQ